MHKIIYIIIIAVFFFSPCHTSFCQPVNQARDTGIHSEERELSESVKKGFEEALRKIDAEKEKEDKKLSVDLQEKFNLAVKDWLNDQKKKRNKELNTMITQQWENLSEFGPRIHYDYYLRDYSYIVINMDITKTLSIINAYKAVMNVQENLFAEKYHSSDVTYPENFYYTVTTPVRVDFEYGDGKFVVTASEYGRSSIEPGWRK